MPHFVRQRHRAPATGPISPDPALPRVAVIGAGSSGLAAAKALHAERIPFVCFEMGQRIGGNWVIDNPNGVSAAYETLEINTSKPRMAFRDFPMPAHYPPYARHDQVADYFESYVDHFGFRQHIAFGTRVERVEPDGDGWVVTVTSTGDDASAHDPAAQTRVQTRTERFDAVLVANGHHWQPHWPEPAYPGEFAGQQLHAHEYRDASVLVGRDVVVVGSGNSAMDIACEAARVGRSAILSQRRGEHVLRKVLFDRLIPGGVPTDQVVLPSWVPWWTTAVRLELAAALSGSVARLGLPVPGHRASQSHPVQSEGIRPALASGRLQAKGAISRFAGDRVEFADGTSAPADLIVWATGYDVAFPFFDAALSERLGIEGNALPLWHRAVQPDVPGLFFIGLLQPVGAVMPLAEAQAEWVAEWLSGRYAAPSPEVMRAELRAVDEANRQRFYASRRHTMEVDFDRFLWDLGSERRKGRARAVGQPATTVGHRLGALAAVARAALPGSGTGLPATAEGARRARHAAAALGSRGGGPTSAVVTGAAGGLGREIALLLARRGHLVHVTDVDAAGAASVVAEIERAGGQAIAHSLDVRDGAAVRVVADAAAAAAPLEVWVNNAGIFTPGPVWASDAAVWQRHLDINAMGVVHGTTAALEHMRAAGRGHIVTIASLAGLVPVPGEAVYAGSKHAVVGFSTSTLADLRLAGHRDIHISTVCPDGIWTPMLYDRLDDPEAALSFSGTLFRPEQVAGFVGEVLDRPRPLLARPRHRAAFVRTVALLPGLVPLVVPLVRADAERRQRRMRAHLEHDPAWLAHRAGR